MSRPKILISLCVVMLGGLLLGAVRWLKTRGPGTLQQPSLFVQDDHSSELMIFADKSNLLVTGERGETGMYLEHPGPPRPYKPGRISVWAGTTGQKLREFSGLGEEMWVSEDGHHLFTAQAFSRNQSRLLWFNLDTGLKERERSIPGSVGTVSRDLNAVFTSAYHPIATKRMEVRGWLYQAKTDKLRGPISLPGSAWNSRFSPDGQFVCLPNDNNASLLLRCADLKPALPLPPLQALRMSKDSQKAVGISSDNNLNIWDISGGGPTQTATDFKLVRWLYLLTDGTIVLSGDIAPDGDKSRKTVIEVHSADGRNLLRTLPNTFGNFSNDGRFEAISVSIPDRRGYSNGATAYYDVTDVSTGQSVIRLDCQTDALGQLSHVNGFSDARMALADDGRRFAIGSSTGLIRFYDRSRASTIPWQMVRTSGGETALHFNSRVLDAVAMPNGGVAASGSDNQYAADRLLRVLDSHGTVRSFPAVVGNADVGVLGVSPDGSTLMGSSQWGLWRQNVLTGTNKTTSPSVAPDGTPSYLGWNQGRPYWLSGPDKPPSVISIGSQGEEKVTLYAGDFVSPAKSRVIVPATKGQDDKSYSVEAAVPSPDGRRVLVLWNGFTVQSKAHNATRSTANYGLAEIIDTQTGRLIRNITISRAGGFPSSIAALGVPSWSPDGKLIALPDAMGRIFIVDSSTGLSVGQLSGARVENGGYEAAFVETIFSKAPLTSFSPDNGTLAAGRDDGSIYLYSLKTFLPIAQIGKATTALRWLQFSADGSKLYGVCSNSADVLSWDVPRV